MTKRLPQAGEVWFTRNGETDGPLKFRDNGNPYVLHGTYSYTKNGQFYPSKLSEEGDLVLIHKDATGRVVHATFDPALIGKDEEKRKPNVYEFWECNIRNKVETGFILPRYDAGTFYVLCESGWGVNNHIEDHSTKANAYAIQQNSCVRPSTQSEIDAWIAKHGKPAKYNPQPTQEPTMPTESDPITKAIAESQDRTKGLQDLQTKLAKAATMQGDLKALRLEIALLRDKYPIEAKPTTWYPIKKPKAKKVGKKVK